MCIYLLVIVCAVCFYRRICILLVLQWAYDGTEVACVSYAVESVPVYGNIHVAIAPCVVVGDFSYVYLIC